MTSKYEHNDFILLQINKDKTVLHTKTLSDRQNTIDILDSIQAAYYTFTSPNEKPAICIISAINKSFDEQDIRESINTLGFDLEIILLKIQYTTKDAKVWTAQLMKN